MGRTSRGRARRNGRSETERALDNLSSFVDACACDSREKSAPPTMRYDVYESPRDVTTLDVSETRFATLGRHKDATVRVGDGDASVSRRHAELRVTAKGALEVRDCGSTHGTRIDGRAGACGETWTEILKAADDATDEVALVLGKGSTRVVVKKIAKGCGDGGDDDDDGSETEPEDDGSDTEPAGVEDAAVAGAERRSCAEKRDAAEPTMGEAEVVFGDLYVKNTDDVDATTAGANVDDAGSGRANFKKFKKQRVVGLNATRSTHFASESSVYEREETAEDRNAREREEANEEEADALFSMGLPGLGKAAPKRRAPAKKKR